MTGVPPSAQRLVLKTPSKESVAIEAGDEDNTYLASFPLTPYAELQVSLEQDRLPVVTNRRGRQTRAYSLCASCVGLATDLTASMAIVSALKNCRREGSWIYRTGG